MFTKSYRFTLLLVLMIIGISQGLRAQTLTFTVATDTAGPGDIVEIPISVSNFLSIQGYQGTIAWDSAALDFVSLVSPTPGISNIFGTPGMGLVPLNAATFTWVDFSGVGKTLSAGTVVMKITFQVKSSASFGVTPVIINSSVTLLGYTTGSGLITPNVNQGSVLVTGCIATADPSFTYPATACQFGANPLANITGDPGGTFTVDQGASINPATGELDLATTLPGTTYQVTYTVGSPCPAVSNRSIHIQPLDDASFTFVDSVCFNSANPAAVVTGLNGGTFFVNNGATINPATGILDLTTTAPGLTYLITYQTQGLCPDFSNQSVYVADTADVSFVYPASVCPGSANPVATITGAVGGIFSVSPSASINPATGELDINSITPGIIYTITYSLSDICQSFSQRQIVVEDTTPPTVICQNITVTLGSTGSAVIDVSMIDAGSADNCGIFSLTLSQDSFGVADIGVQTVTLTVVDNSGNSSSCVANVTVQDNSCVPTADPSFIFPGTVCADGANPVAMITGDPGGTFSVNQGAVIDSVTGELDLTTTIIGTTYQITYSVDSVCPAISSQSVYVADTADVSFVYPASVCPGSTNPVATITGTGGGTFSVSPSAGINPATGELDINSITPGIIYTITYSLSDICQSFSQRQIVVEDTTPPTVICQNITVTLDSTGSSVIDVSMIDAGSADNCGIFSLTLSQDSFGVADIGVQTVTLTVVDNSGNSSSCEATVTVEGTTSISGHITPGLSLSVYPNPVENVLNMQWDSPWQGKVSIVMVNALGQIISTENKIKHSQQMEAELSFGALPSGMYIIQVSQDGYTQHKRVFRK